MKAWQRYLVAAALVVLGHEGLAGPKAGQLVTQTVLPSRVQSFAPTIQPGSDQARAIDGFGNNLNQSEAGQKKGRFTWGILGHGVGFNKRF